MVHVSRSSFRISRPDDAIMTEDFADHGTLISLLTNKLQPHPALSRSHATMKLFNFSLSSGFMSTKSKPFPTCGYRVATTAVVRICSPLTESVNATFAPISKVNIVSI